jgi:hypothetical protein
MTAPAITAAWVDLLRLEYACFRALGFAAPAATEAADDAEDDLSMVGTKCTMLLPITLRKKTVRA